MSYSATILQILIASPGDVSKERNEITNVLLDWNSSHGKNFGFFLQPVMWEQDSIPEQGDRPQELLNKQFVRDCDILIANFWTRLGTNTGTAESGTVEEIEEFKKQKKTVLLYFSSQPVDPNSIDQEQFKLLTIFKKKSKRQGLYCEYSSVEDFRKKLYSHLTKTIIRLKEKTPNNLQSVITSSQLRDEYKSSIQSFRDDWLREEKEMPTDLSDAKSILSNLLNFLKKYIKNYHKSLSDETIRMISCNVGECKKLLEHKLYPDGGKSFNEFWMKGGKTFADCYNIYKKI